MSAAMAIDSPGQHRRGGHRIAQHVQEGGARVEVVIAAQPDQDDRVAEETHRRHPGHDPQPDRRVRVLQAVPGLPGDPHRQPEQRGHVELRRQDLQPPEAEGALHVGRARPEDDGQERQPQRRHVGEHVAGVGDEGERARPPAAERLQHHDERRDRERHGQPLHAARLGGAVRGVVVLVRVVVAVLVRVPGLAPRLCHPPHLRLPLCSPLS
jgi:hypothetical protein